MKYVWIVCGIMLWCAFAYDIEYDRDFLTWMWLLSSQLCFFAAYVAHKNELHTKSDSQKEIHKK